MILFLGTILSSPGTALDRLEDLLYSIGRRFGGTTYTPAYCEDGPGVCVYNTLRYIA